MLLSVFWRGSAEKPEDAFAPISWCVTWTCRLLMSMMEEGWRSSWTGLPLRGGAQLAIDTTMVCALHRDGTPRRQAAECDGVALKAARRKKEATYPELLGPRRRAQLVVIAVEVGGRWSPETRSFFSQLARARARGERPLLRLRAEQAWRMRWGAMFACAAARAVASSLLDLAHSHGAAPAAHEVEGDHRYAGLAG